MTTQGINAGPTRRQAPRAWPFILIAAGAALLLWNLGWVNWEVLDLYYLVPLLLVAFGIDMLTRGRYRLFVVLGTVAALAFVQGSTAKTLGFGVASPEAVAVAQGIEGARSAEVVLSTGVSAVRVRSAASAQLLATGEIRPLRGEQIEQTFSVDEGVARLELASHGRIRPFPGDNDGRWDLELTGRLPLALNVSTGVGEAILDISDLQLTSLAMSTGVGATRTTLPVGSYAASVDTGVGAAAIRIPTGVAARVVASRGIGDVSVPASFQRDGNVYTSPDYHTAANRIELRVSTGVGAVDIVHYQ